MRIRTQWVCGIFAPPGLLTRWGNRTETLQTFRLYTSTNLRDWSESFCVTQWVSELSVMTVVYSAGTATVTNWAEDAYGTNCWSFDASLMSMERAAAVL